MSQPEVLYANISAENEPCVMESICVNCEKQGKTTVLLTKIPMFSEIIIVSFECEHCGYKNNEVQFGGKIKEQGVKYELTARSEKDLQRQIVRSEFCRIMLPDLDFQMPSNKKGTVTTLEGFLSNIIEDLSLDQPVRKYTNPEVYEKLEVLIEKLKAYKDGSSFPFKWTMYDPSGNSFIQNPNHPQADKDVKQTHFIRTKHEIEEMGFSVENQKIEKQQEEEQQPQDNSLKHLDGIYTSHEKIQANNQDFNKAIVDDVKEEGLVFPTQCNACGETGENKMCQISIPHFKNVLIMSFTCQHCGNKDTEIKSMGEISQMGRKITIQVDGINDLKRDVFFSETASLNLPEIELELATGSLKGVYSTIEGLVDQILTHLRDNNPFAGDVTYEFNNKLEYIFKKLEEFKSGDVKFTMIIRDLVENSFVQNINGDPNIIIESFERTAEDNDDLGIDTMKTENYS